MRELLLFTHREPFFVGRFEWCRERGVFPTPHVFSSTYKLERLDLIKELNLMLTLSQGRWARFLLIILTGADQSDGSSHKQVITGLVLAECMCCAGHIRTR